MNERILLAGYFDHKIFRDGWYDVERDPVGIIFRASGPRANVYHGCEKGRYSLHLLLTARPEHSGEPLRGKISCGNSSLAFSLKHNLWSVRSGNLELEEEELTIEVKNPWSPDRLYKNGDVRSLGILLSAIHLMPRKSL